MFANDRERVCVLPVAFAGLPDTATVNLSPPGQLASLQQLSNSATLPVLLKLKPYE